MSLKTLTIEGGRPLHGTVHVSGAKNAVLPLLSATAAHGGRYRLENCPALSDVDATVDILEHLGCRVRRDGDAVEVDSRGLRCARIPREKMLRLRSSVLFLGALLARCGQAQLWLPGGCCIGQRPIDLHLSALKELGARVTEEDARVTCACPRLRGGAVRLRYPSVGATENLMLAALGAEGPVTIVNAAREPEVAALARFLRAMGAGVTGEGSGVIRLCPPEAFHDVRFRVPPDRIEAATWLCAVASAGGDATVSGVRPEELAPVIACLRSAGMRLETKGGTIRAVGADLHAAGAVRTGPYPAFPTDAQAPLMAALLKAEGTTYLTETVFEHRFRHVPALRAMGGDIELSGRRARIRGVPALHGADVAATDLRGGAAMVIAALGARGESRISQLAHMERGYDRLVEKLRGLGAGIDAE